MSDHVSKRRALRRQMAQVALLAAILATPQPLVLAVLVEGAAAKLSEVASVLISGITGLLGIAGWYMKVGSDENRHQMQLDRDQPLGKPAETEHGHDRP